jgi:hypothetical protein
LETESWEGGPCRLCSGVNGGGVGRSLGAGIGGVGAEHAVEGH